ncbi:Arc family DNA-binding protein [Pseudooceanicola atlanticus]|uniref:Arc family DNA-binding protein n=1 Tax=Pseudooceanicola atlanticus TaxID=1461694 RepID=UPI002356DCF1|nr:Arc family DNA-binding protein [Pseudooceanicola atlanticus]
MATVGRGAEQYTVRFPDGLRDRIRVAAELNGRSMNAEIVATLMEHYPQPEPPGFEEAYSFFQSVPEDQQKELIFEIMRRKGITAEDIEDGLVPGVRPKK